MTVISVKHSHLLLLSYRTLRQILFCFVFQDGRTGGWGVCVCVGVGGGGCVYKGQFSTHHVFYDDAIIASGNLLGVSK